MRIILLANEIDSEDLKIIVKETEIHNIITENTIEKIKEEMLICISPNGMTREDINTKFELEHGLDLNPSNYTFASEIKIALIGSMKRMGTTTTSLNIATYLESIGAKVSYTEANNKNHLQDIHKMFFEDQIINENYFTANGIDYFFNFNIPSVDYDFSIIDLGEINDNSIKMFNVIEGVKILCAGIKPYEISSLNNSIESFKNSKDYHILIPKGNMIDIENYIPDYKNYTIHRIDYSKSLLNGNINKNVWEILLDRYLVKNDNQVIK